MLPTIGSIILMTLSNQPSTENKNRLELNFPVIVNVQNPCKKRKTRKQ